MQILLLKSEYSIITWYSKIKNKKRVLFCRFNCAKIPDIAVGVEGVLTHHGFLPDVPAAKMM
jgi:hypothetical protein